MNMKTYTFILLNFISSLAGAQVFTGTGFSPLIENDVSISRMLATFDAIGDALMKSSVSLQSETQIEDSLMSSQTLGLKMNLNINIKHRKCARDGEVMRCEVEVQTNETHSYVRRKPSGKIVQCNSQEMLSHCFAIRSHIKTQNGIFIITRLEIDEKVRWRNVVIKSQGKVYRGVGADNESSLRSAITQIRKDPVTENLHAHLQDYGEVIASKRNLKEEHRMYLSLLGGYTSCEGQVCWLLLPKLLI